MDTLRLGPAPTCLICQLQIDRLNLEGYANLEHWVARLDERIEGTLLQRLTAIIQLWCAEFERADDDDSHARHSTIASRDRDATISRRGGRGDKKLQQMLLLKGDSDKVRISCILCFSFSLLPVLCYV